MFVTKVRGEWESDSGRQLTLQDVNASELSRVELQALQRVAINQLQSLDIPVSHGLIKGVLFGGIIVDPSESCIQILFTRKLYLCTYNYKDFY